jgi:hypothetical protein
MLSMSGAVSKLMKVSHNNVSNDNSCVISRFDGRSMKRVGGVPRRGAPADETNLQTHKLSDTKFIS